jgi:hypothetical protein
MKDTLEYFPARVEAAASQKKGPGVRTCSIAGAQAGITSGGANAANATMMPTPQRTSVVVCFDPSCTAAAARNADRRVGVVDVSVD